MAKTSPISIPLTPAYPDSPGRRFLVHTVKPGDSLWRIASEHGLNVEDLIQVNLEYNLPTLTQYNPNLLADLTALGDAPFYQVSIQIRPGQVILIHETGVTQCREGSKTGPEGELEVVADCGRTSPHRDSVYIPRGVEDSMDGYQQFSYVETNGALRALLDGRQDTYEADMAAFAREMAAVNQVPGQTAGLDRIDLTGPATARSMAISAATQDLEDRAVRMHCQDHDYACMGQRQSLFDTADNRRRYIEQNLGRFDADKDGVYSEDEISDLIGAAEAAWPLK